ncbi:MAG TPA: hypothetical protein VNA04_09330 [Thermoanaerobaculia bacterium]|nr:hypothetical protein [Thermoanaerobaculia bacterium]
MLPDSREPVPSWSISPMGLVRAAIHEMPSMRYALGVGGIAAVVSIVLTGWKLEPQTAIIGGLVVFVAMVILVIFAALSRTGSTALRPLALAMAWAFLSITVTTAVLFVSCAFFNTPKTLECLLGNNCGATTVSTDLSASSDDAKEIEAAIARGEAILDSLYAGEYETIYAQFSGMVQQAVPFAQFRAVARRETAQLRGGPLHRKLRAQPRPEAGFLFVAFEAEFDEVARWLEGVTFVKVSDGWALYRIDVQPASWANATGTTKLLFETDPAEVIEKRGENAVAHWLPQRGWRGIMSRVIAKRAEKSCDVELRSGSVALKARNMLGGCELSIGSTIDVVGKITSVGQGTLDLDEVRYQPADG